ncbi:MAG TPA: ATP-binding cassette domain-containing protein, partial [Caldithrix abyssi]|nr:ATP-binding cassette domain-containing protein [Caldithrix abyssi]
MLNRSILSGDSLIKTYSKRNVVNDISLNVRQGEIVGLLGPNGAGKTTTFYIITGMIRPNSGTVSIDGEDITDFPMYKRARKGVAYLPQEASVFRKLTVEENLLAILEMLGVPKKERLQKTEQYLNELNITHIAKSLGYHLSGGERRRTEIARTL